MKLGEWKEYDAMMTSAPDALERLLSERIHASKLLKNDDLLPDSPGAYAVFVDDQTRPHYIGSSKNLRRRVCRQLLRGKNHTYWKHMADTWKRVVKEDQMVFAEAHWNLRYLSAESELEALILEHIAKFALKPEYDELLSTRKTEIESEHP